jgi:hypothetical protein
MNMTDKQRNASLSPDRLGASKEQTQEMINVQRELLDAYEQINLAWLERVKSEAAFWTELAETLTAARSVPAAVDAYQKSIARRIQMTTDDGQRIRDDIQTIAQIVTQSMSTRLPAGRT